MPRQIVYRTTRPSLMSLGGLIITHPKGGAAIKGQQRAAPVGAAWSHHISNSIL
jgi:hypothetical protein